MNKLYKIIVYISTTLSLHSMEITPLPMPEEINQHILLHQFNYISKSQDSFWDTCTNIIILKRINKSCYEHINDPKKILSFIHKLYEIFPKEAHVENLLHRLNSPAVTNYCKKSKQLNPLYNNNLNAFTITELIHEGADVNCRIEHLTRGIIGTPLMYFASNPYYNNDNNSNNEPHLECIQTLLDLGADQNIQSDNKSALKCAISEQNSEAITLLLRHNPSSMVLQQALCTAIKIDNSIMNTIIGKMKEYSDCITEDLAPGLCTAVKLNKPEIVDGLLTIGANPDQALTWLTKHILCMHIEEQSIDQHYETFALLCRYLPHYDADSQATKYINKLNAMISVATKLLNTINNNGEK